MDQLGDPLVLLGFREVELESSGEGYGFLYCELVEDDVVLHDVNGTLAEQF